MSTRQPKVANQFYPGNAAILRQDVWKYIDEAEDVSLAGTLKALICPHAGYIYSGPVSGYSYKVLKKNDDGRKWKVLLLGPSHYVSFIGAAVSSDEKWKTPLGEVSVGDIRKEISGGKNIVEMKEAHMQEHSLEVQIPFLQIALKNFVVYPLVFGSVRPDFLGEELSEFAQKDDVIIIASSDLSHYLPYDEAREKDLATSEAICSIDVEKMAEIGDACGRMGILTVMYLAEKSGWKCKMLSYMNSGDTAGDRDRVVGYGAYAFYK